MTGVLMCFLANRGCGASEGTEKKANIKDSRLVSCGAGFYCGFAPFKRVFILLENWRKNRESGS
jgi:hypothetical protein